MDVASAIISTAQSYCLIGVAVAAVFLTVGIDRIDEDARGAYAFRPLLIPAILLIWPLVLWRWLREETGMARPLARYAPPRRIQTVAALLTAALIALVLLAGFAVRQTWPADLAPVQISGPEEAGE